MGQRKPRTEEHSRRITEGVRRSWGTRLAQEIVKSVIDHFGLTCRISDYPARPLIPKIQQIIDKHMANATASTQKGNKVK